MSDDTIRIFAYNVAVESMPESAQTPSAIKSKDGIWAAAGAVSQPESVWNDDPEATTPESPSGSPEGSKLGWYEVGVEVVEKELAKVLKAIDRAVSHAESDAEMTSLQVMDISVSLAVGANGTIGLSGVGAGLTGTTTLMLKLGRKA
ncbi:MAG: hypothetical protein HC925_05725 [Coleofasciculaceae cyanobacterium SM2_3_26]|nr:hypothetical protein [Coleofasciculaceae cyanobacterium SM2_3_26]